MFFKNLLANEIVDIINAGNVAKCASISYNGLYIAYALKPDSAVVEPLFVPSDFQEPSLPAVDSAFAESIAKQDAAANELENLLLTDPLRYEQLIHQEE